ILLFSLCVMLHALLVIGCMVLIILHFTQPRSAISFSGNGLNVVQWNIFYYATVSPNTIIKVYLVPTLFITQKLAFRRTVHVNQTLTSIHDKTSAWLGLGATAPVLWRYLTAFIRKKEDRAAKRGELPAFVGVSLITIYLSCSLLLGIIAPDLVTVADTVGDTGSYQKIASNLQGVDNDAFVSIQEAFPIVNILPLVRYSGDIATVGLENNLIYDVPNFATSTGSVGVLGKSFWVHCGQIQGASQVQSDDDSFVIHVEEQLQNVKLASKRTLNIRPALWQNISDTSPPPATIIVASTFPIQDDSEDANAAIVNLNTEVTPVGCSFDCDSVNTVQVVACNVLITNHGENDEVPVETDVFPFQVNAPTTITSQAWSNWSLPNPPVGGQSLLSLIGNFSQQSPNSRTTLFSTVDGSTATNYTLSILEDSIMETLGYYDPSILRVDLSELENNLGQAVAAVFWRSNLFTLFIAALRQVDNASLGPDTSSYALEYAVLVCPILGLVVSTVMLVVSILLTWQPKPDLDDKTRPQVDSFGVLQLMWYLGQERNHLSRYLARAVPDPTLEHLRDWGK
ncbi:uncharacterized protein PHACADRAFT_63701, partial [Phanerochaete carnosa HHB-10118-sp]